MPLIEYLKTDGSDFHMVPSREDPVCRLCGWPTQQPNTVDPTIISYHMPIHRRNPEGGWEVYKDGGLTYYVASSENKVPHG